MIFRDLIYVITIVFACFMMASTLYLIYMVRETNEYASKKIYDRELFGNYRNVKQNSSENIL